MSGREDLPGLLRLTPARVRLDPKGGPLPMADLLRFQEDHAGARDAIFGQADWEAIAAGLAPLATLRVASRARDRAEYLRRPDLGRRLAEGAALPRLDAPLVVVIGDGLSAAAVNRHAVPLIHQLSRHLPELASVPVILASGARVGLGDEIGAALGAGMVLMLIGERPGLSVADSLGAYLTLGPRLGLRDSARNCVSNIHDHGGLSHAAAAERLSWLIAAARDLGATGVALKDESGGAGLLPGVSAT